MAKKAATKSSETKSPRSTTRKSSSSGQALQARPARASSDDDHTVTGDAVDALLKLLQSPLVVDLLAVGATAALAAITEQRSSRARGTEEASGKVMKAAGKAAAAAIGRRIANEMDEIRKASRKTKETEPA